MLGLVEVEEEGEYVASAFCDFGARVSQARFEKDGAPALAGDDFVQGLEVDAAA